MNWATLVSVVLPAIQPIIIAGLGFLFTLIGTQLFHLLMASRFKSVAATIVAAIEDQHDKLDGSGKLNLAVDSLVSKFRVGGVQIISNADAEAYVREAYLSLVKPLDALKTPLAPSSTASTASVKPATS